MKSLLTFSILLLILSLNAQTLSIREFERIYKRNSIEEKCDALYNKGFIKESSAKSTNIRLVKKKFIKKTQSFEEEIITFSKDTLIYSLSNPKQYINLKTELDYWRQEKSENPNISIFKQSHNVILISESDEAREENKSIKLYNFSLYKIPKK